MAVSPVAWFCLGVGRGGSCRCCYFCFGWCFPCCFSVFFVPVGSVFGWASRCLCPCLLASLVAVPCLRVVVAFGGLLRLRSVRLLFRSFRSCFGSLPFFFAAACLLGFPVLGLFRLLACLRGVRFGVLFPLLPVVPGSVGSVARCRRCRRFVGVAVSVRCSLLLFPVGRVLCCSFGFSRRALPRRAAKAARKGRHHIKNKL